MLYMDLVFMFYINWFVLEYSYLKYEFENQDKVLPLSDWLCYQKKTYIT